MKFKRFFNILLVWKFVFNTVDRVIHHCCHDDWYKPHYQIVALRKSKLKLTRGHSRMHTSASGPAVISIWERTNYVFCNVSQQQVWHAPFYASLGIQNIYHITHSYLNKLKIKQRVLVREFLSQFSTKLHQNLINSSLGNGKCMCKIWRQNVYYFLSYRVHRQTHIHTHIYKPRWLHNLLAEVTMHIKEENTHRFRQD